MDGWAWAALFASVALVTWMVYDYKTRSYKTVPETTTAKQRNISARDFTIYAKEKGFEVLGPFETGDLQRLNFKKHSGLLMIVFYKGDLIKEIMYSVQITSNRNELKQHFADISYMLKYVDPIINEWVTIEVSKINPKSAAEREYKLENRNIAISYSPDPDMDVLNFTYTIN